MAEGNIISFGDALQKRQRELWDTLLEELDCIENIGPWEYVKAGDTLAYIPQEGGQVLFFNCAKEKNGVEQITLYPGGPAYLNVLEPSEDGREEFRRFIEMDSISFFWGERDQVPGYLKTVLKGLEADYGTGRWPWFLRKRRGYASRPLNEQDLTQAVDAMGNFMMMMNTMVQEGIELKENEMLLRFYDPKEQGWVNMVSPLAVPRWEHRPLVLWREEGKLKELRTSPISLKYTQVEFDYGWQQGARQDTPEDDPYFPIVAVFADRQTGEPLLIWRCHPEDLTECIFTAWSEVIGTRGRPESLYLCREETADLLADLARQLDVRIRRVKELPAAAQILMESGAV